MHFLGLIIIRKKEKNRKDIEILKKRNKKSEL
jgi:hypothetical protein